MFVGALTVDLLLGGNVSSLKHKRAVLRPLLAGLRRHLELAVAETGHQDLLRRAEIGLSTVSGDHAQVQRVLDDAERWLWSRQEVELVSVDRWLRSTDDE